MSQVDLDQALRRQVADEMATEARQAVQQVKRMVIAAQLAREGELLIYTELEQQHAAPEALEEVKASIDRLEGEIAAVSDQLRKVLRVQRAADLVQQRFRRSPVLARV